MLAAYQVVLASAQFRYRGVPRIYAWPAWHGIDRVLEEREASSEVHADGELLWQVMQIILAVDAL